jgi:hypothetical protein
MSNSDYVTRATGRVFCPVASLVDEIAPLDTVLNITGLKTTGPNDRWVGMGAMIGNEIVRITEINEGNVHVARGCADTVPTTHAAGSLIWFIDSHAGTDRREYVSGQTIGVKVLPKTSSKQTPIANSPPQALTFNHRFIRPYPPGDVKVGSVSLFSAAPQRITATAGLSLSWATRNRIVQADQLIGHLDGSSAPEVGQTTRVRLYRSSDDGLVATTSVTGTTWTYDRTTAAADFSLAALSDTGDFTAYAVIDSLRDGYGSWHSYTLAFAIDTTGLVPKNFVLLESGDKLLLESGDKILLEN